MSILRNYFDKLNKSLSSFGDDENDITPDVDNDINDESYLPSSGTVKKKPCPSCLGLGCCFLCDRPDDFCDLIGCSDRLCKKWLHHSCDNLTSEDVAKIKTYYCPICREKPKCRKWVFYKPSELNTNLKQKPVASKSQEAKSLGGEPPELPGKTQITTSALNLQGLSEINKSNLENAPKKSPGTINLPGNVGNEFNTNSPNIDLNTETCQDPAASMDSTSNDANLNGLMPVNPESKSTTDKNSPVNPFENDYPENFEEPSVSKSPTSNNPHEPTNVTVTDAYINLSSELSSINSDISSTFNTTIESNANPKSPICKHPSETNHKSPDENNPELQDDNPSTPDNGTPKSPNENNSTDNDLSKIPKTCPTKPKSSTPTKSNPIDDNRPPDSNNDDEKNPYDESDDTEKLITPGQQRTERISITETPSIPHQRSSRFSQHFQHDLSILKNSIDDNYKLNELVTSLRAQLKTSYTENQRLREHIRTVEENIPTFSVLDEKNQQISTLTMTISNLRLDLQEKDDYVTDLEHKLQETNERLHLANEKCAEVDKEINQNNPLTMEKRHPRSVIVEYEKLRRLYNSQQKQITELAQLNDHIRKVVSQKSDEVEVLKSQIKDLTKNDIQKKILCMVLDENKKLVSDAQLGRKRLLSLKEHHKNAEQEMIREMEKIKRPNLPTEDSHKDAATSTDEPSNVSGEWETFTDDSITDIPEYIKVIPKAPNQKKETADNPTGDAQIPDTFDSSKTLVFENTSKKEENETYRRGANFMQPGKSQSVCKWHLRGICRFGKWCRNLHPNSNQSSNMYPSYNTAPNGQYRQRQDGSFPHYSNPYSIPKHPIPSLFANPHPFPYPYPQMSMFNFPPLNPPQFPNSFLPAPSNNIPNQLPQGTHNQNSSFTNPNLITLTQ